jgi:RNA polymerase sigma factor (sigma-70 family)
MYGYPLSNKKGKSDMGLSYCQLRTADLAELITAAQSDDRDDSQAMNEIIRRFDGKARRIAAAVCLREANRDDVADAASLALVRAVRGHDATRQGFVTYALAFMTGAARRESIRLAYSAETCFDDAHLAAAIDNPRRRQTAGRMAVDVSWGSGPLSKIIVSLSASQQQLLDERYVRDLDLAQIAQMHGSSVSAVSQRLGTVYKHIVKILQQLTVPTAAAA